MAMQYGEGGSISVMMEGPFGGVGSSVKLAEVVLPVSEWKGAESPYSQAVTVEGISQKSMVNLQLSVEQLAQFHNKDIAFTAVNENGAVTVYAIGDKPDRDYTIQATISEVIGNSETIIGSTVGTTMPRADWSQTDESKADFIRNKPTDLINNALQTTGGNMIGALNMNGYRLFGIIDPEDRNHAANKKYVDETAKSVEEYVDTSLDAAKTASVSATLTAAGWVGNSVPYTQAIQVAGLTDGKRARAYPVYGDDTDANLALKEACGMVSFASRSGSSMTFTCLEEKPSVDIPVTVEVYV